MLLFAAQVFFHLAIALEALNFIIPTHKIKRSPIQFSRMRSLKAMDLSLLPQVIQNLEQHENSVRLKKLLVYVCQQVWENDLTVIDNASWQDYIQELISKNSTIESLKRNVYGMAKTTTKPKQYLSIADILIRQLKQLYFIKDEVTQAYFVNFQPALIHEETPELFKTNRLLDSFQLKLNIITAINPLKAKILLFSALNEQFNFSSQDWINLRAQQLDDLLQNLFELYPTFTELKNRLEDTANTMRNLDESMQVARVISQYFKPYYA